VGAQERVAPYPPVNSASTILNLTISKTKNAISTPCCSSLWVPAALPRARWGVRPKGLIRRVKVLSALILGRRLLAVKAARPVIGYCGFYGRHAALNFLETPRCRAQGECAAKGLYTPRKSSLGFDCWASCRLKPPGPLLGTAAFMGATPR
jgi:hypothetical protein